MTGPASSRDGGSAFPADYFDNDLFMACYPEMGLISAKQVASVRSKGMTLRDYFATAVDKDEYGDLIYRNASRLLMEALAGPAPNEPRSGATREQTVAYQLANMEWEMRFRAAVRYRLADAMLAERAKEGGS